MTLSEIKKELKKMATTNLPKALKKYEEVLTSDSYRFNEIILQQGSYNSLKNDKLRGVINDSRATQRENQIRYAVIDMVDMLDDEDVDLEKSKTVFSKKEKTPESPPEESPEPSTENKVYISYAWKGRTAETAHLEEIVNLLEKELTERGIELIRDKNDLKYKGSIKAFMEDIGRGSKVIVVLSKKYLESDYCMFELTRVYKNENFTKRIFPIVLADADIYDPISVIDYINYWDEKISTLDAKLRTVRTGTNLKKLQDRLNEYAEIRTTIDDITFILQDMNALSPDIHHDEDFQTLYNHLTGS